MSSSPAPFSPREPLPLGNNLPAQDRNPGNAPHPGSKPCTGRDSFPALLDLFSCSLQGQPAFPNPPRALMSCGEFQENEVGGLKSELICSLREMEKGRVRYDPELGSWMCFASDSIFTSVNNKWVLSTNCRLPQWH